MEFYFLGFIYAVTKYCIVKIEKKKSVLAN